MIGLTFLAVGVAWLALSLWLARKLPAWVGLKHPVGKWLLGAAVMTVLLIGPFVDHIVGMRQFEKLCAANEKMNINASAGLVKRAKSSEFRLDDLQGYWIRIQSQPVSYIDMDTNQPFISYRGLHTSGGRIAGIAMMGGTHTCWPKNRTPELQKLNIEKLIEQGKTP